MKLNIKIYLDFFRSEILQEKKLKSTRLSLFKSYVFELLIYASQYINVY
jgi:hypothetical protein